MAGCQLIQESGWCSLLAVPNGELVSGMNLWQSWSSPHLRYLTSRERPQESDAKTIQLPERADPGGVVQESEGRLGDLTNHVNKHAKSAPVYLAPVAEV